MALLRKVTCNLSTKEPLILFCEQLPATWRGITCLFHLEHYASSKCIHELHNDIWRQDVHMSLWSSIVKSRIVPTLHLRPYAASIFICQSPLCAFMNPRMFTSDFMRRWYCALVTWRFILCIIWLSFTLVLIHDERPHMKRLTWLAQSWHYVFASQIHTGWRRPIGCLKSQGIFRKRATNYRALLRRMTYQDKAS